MSSHLFRIQFADGRVEERTFGEGRFPIGSASAAIVLPDPRVSALHGELVVSGGHVTYTDLGSSNGSLDARGRRITGSVLLLPGQSVELGSSALSFLRSLPPGAQASGGVGSSAVASGAVALPAPLQPASVVRAADTPNHEALPSLAAVGASTGSSGYSHPDRPIRHSYPLAIPSASFGDAVRLLLATFPFVLARLGISLALTFATILYWVVLAGGYVLLARATPLLGWAWIGALLVVAGSIWRLAVRYLLYLVKAAHIAVLTELITLGRISGLRDAESMFQYGKRTVTERFGEVNAMFGLGLLISGIVGAFNRTLDWVAQLLPIPGLDSIMGIVRSVLRASTTYIDESIFSYNLARGDENVLRSSRDGLIYYAQNAKEVLKTGLWVVVLDRVLSVMVWVVMLGPAFALGYLMPGKASLAGIVFAFLFAANVRAAVLRPLFLTLVMVKFHSLIQGQPIDLGWDQRLTEASGKFADLKRQAEAWIRPGRGPQPNRTPQAA
jgi:hypothetical protein